MIASCNAGNIISSGASVVTAYFQYRLKDSVVVYECPLWLEKFKLTEEEKASTHIEVKRKLVAFNRKVEAFCEKVEEAE